MVLASALRFLDQDEIYVLAARAGVERVSFGQCADELTELRGCQYSAKQCERIFAKLRTKLLPFALLGCDTFAVAS
jgi:hypothetical protein